VAEGTGSDVIDLGWFAGEPLVGQPRALAGLAAKSDAAAVVFADFGYGLLTNPLLDRVYYAGLAAEDALGAGQIDHHNRIA